MKTPKITQVRVWDGSALYVDGNLVSDWFTVGEGDLLRAVGFKSWDSVQANQEHYRHAHWPKKLKNVVRA
jgi:hypothetical protein